MLRDCCVRILLFPHILTRTHGFIFRVSSKFVAPNHEYEHKVAIIIIIAMGRWLCDEWFTVRSWPRGRGQPPVGQVKLPPRRFLLLHHHHRVRLFSSRFFFARHRHKFKFFSIIISSKTSASRYIVVTLDC